MFWLVAGGRIESQDRRAGGWQPGWGVGAPGGGVEDPSQVGLGSRGIWGKNNSPQYLCNEALQAPIHMQDH